MSPVEVLFPLIFVVMTGFICAKKQWLNVQQLDGLRTFIFNLAIPVFLFISMYQADLAQALSPSLMMSFYLPVIFIYFVSCFVVHKCSNNSLADSAVLALASCYSNTVLVGLPIIMVSLGETMAALVFMIITFHSALLFACTFLLSAAMQGRMAQLLKSLFLNPVVLSISLGIVVNASGLELAEPLKNGLKLLAEPAIAGALFALGASLNQYSISNAWKPALGVSMIKLLLLPLCIYLISKGIFSLPDEQVAVVTLMGASPLGVNAYLVARQLNRQQSVLASSVVMSTLLSTITLSMWLLVLIP